MANASIFAAFERLWQHILLALDGKSDTSHTHTPSDVGADPAGSAAAALETANGNIKSLDDYIGDLPTGAKATTVIGYVDEKVAEIDFPDFSEEFDAVYGEINKKADANHTHTGYAASDHTHEGVYAPSAHGHGIGDISGLQSALDGKADASHSHSELENKSKVTIVRWE